MKLVLFGAMPNQTTFLLTLRMMPGLSILEADTLRVGWSEILQRQYKVISRACLGSLNASSIGFARKVGLQVFPGHEQAYIGTGAALLSYRHAPVSADRFH